MYQKILKKIQNSSNLTNEERKHIEDLITKDELTGAFNRRHFNETIKEEIERSTRIGYDVSLLMIDIDHFKKYNDTKGHQEGDKILQKVTHTIKKSIRNIDGVYRYGGEEYSVILPKADNKQAEVIAERIRNNIEKETEVTVSIGNSSYDKISNSLHDLVSHSDYALYDSKRNGRNQTTTYQPIK